MQQQSAISLALVERVYFLDNERNISALSPHGQFLYYIPFALSF